MYLPKEVIQVFGLYEASVENMEGVLDEEEICTQGWEVMLRELEYRGVETAWILYVFAYMSFSSISREVWTDSISLARVQLFSHNPRIQNPFFLF